MRGTPLGKRRFSTLVEVTRARFSHFWRGGEHVFMILTTTANIVCFMRQGVTRARYSSCSFKNYKQIFTLKTGKADFQFITLRPKAGLKMSCFYLRTRSCLNSKTRVIRHGWFDELGKNLGEMTPVHYAAQKRYANGTSRTTWRRY